MNFRLQTVHLLMKVNSK